MRPSSLLGVGYRRRCSRPSCTRHAAATLTYVYADSTAVLGPLAPTVEPHSYDMCEAHAARLTAPRGWELIRIETHVDPVHAAADMEALANVVRESALREPAVAGPIAPEHSTRDGEELANAIGEGVQRGHLRSVPGVLPGMDY
jgi:hypothetical protein